MMTDLTPQDFAVLDAFVTAKDRIGYWTFLIDKGDMYARLALGVVTNETLNGFVANEFFMDAAEIAGLTPTPEFMQGVGLNIMRADLEARRDAVKEGRSLNLSVKDIQGYHHTVFLKHTEDQIGERGWTAELPLRRYVTEARRTGDWTEADRQWRQLLESDPRSLLDWGALSLGFDSNSDSFHSARGDKVLDWWARSVAEERMGELPKESIPENELGEYGKWWWKTLYSSLKYEVSFEKNISNLSISRIDGYTWDEARQKWIMFKRPAPDLAAGMGRPPLGAGLKITLPQPEFLEIEASPEIAEGLNRKRRNRLEWFHQKRPALSTLPNPQQFALVGGQASPALAGGPRSASLSLAHGGASGRPDVAAVASQEQKGSVLSFAPPPSLMAEPGARAEIRNRIMPPPVLAESQPATVRDLRAAQEALLIELQIAAVNRPPPEIDIYKIRDLLDREFDREVKSGRTFYTDAP